MPGRNPTSRAILIGALAMPVLLSPAHADTPPADGEEVHIVGHPDNIEAIPGSAYSLIDVELEKFEYTDIHRVIRQVPGVYFQEEEGYGLRPNIGIRGSGSGRSDKISIMEDGVLIAPAPYASPAAYYFPTAGRIAGVEVLKGPYTLRYGPFTVGGAINLVSTKIPEDYSGSVNVEAGQHGEQRQHAWYGGMGEQWGFLIESHRHEADGFHDIARSNRDSGFDKDDYMAKLRWRSSEEAAVRQRLDLKISRAEETSDTSYLGLTDADFNRTPYARYGLTELDQMTNKQRTATLRHRLDFSDALNLTTTAYRTEFERNWYKVDRIDGNGISSIIDRANNNDAMAIGILHGTVDTTGIEIKNNAREYYANGLQLELGGRADGGGVTHNWTAGIRRHDDEMDRLQPVDVFDQVNASLVFNSTIAPASAGNNRVEAAEAFSAWLIDEIDFGRWQLTGTARFEDIETERTNYDTVERSSVASRQSNQTDAVLVGLGAVYALTGNWQLLAGAHEGFAPAGGGAGGGTDPEESTNYEFGVRYRGGSTRIDAIAFYSDYRNTVFNCSVANPCTDGRDFGTESLGEADVRGLELALEATLLNGGRMTVPFKAAYTYTDGEISRDSDTGNVLDGDVLPYLPETVLSAILGLEFYNGWNTYLSVSQIDAMCIDNTCGRAGVDERFLKTQDYRVVDFSTHYPLGEASTAYFKVDNLLDETAIVARSPAGARVNKPRTALFGLRVAF